MNFSMITINSDYQFLVLSYIYLLRNWLYEIIILTIIDNNKKYSINNFTKITIQ